MSDIDTEADPFGTSTEDEDELDTSEVEDDEDDGEDAEYDFDHLTPDDGAYAVEIKHVAYRSYDNETTGRHVIGLNVTVQLETNDEFNGQYLTNFIYLGEDKIGVSGLRALKALCDAVGIPCEGRVKFSQFQPAWQTIGKRRDKIWTVFTGLTCGANVETKADKNDVVRTNVVSYMTPELLADIKATPPLADF
jgi:hypothetical protein